MMVECCRRAWQSVSETGTNPPRLLDRLRRKSGQRFQLSHGRDHQSGVQRFILFHRETAPGLNGGTGCMRSLTHLAGECSEMSPPARKAQRRGRRSSSSIGMWKRNWLRLARWSRPKVPRPPASGAHARAEVRNLLGQLGRNHGLVCRLLYSTGDADGGLRLRSQGPGLRTAGGAGPGWQRGARTGSRGAAPETLVKTARSPTCCGG